MSEVRARLEAGKPIRAKVGAARSGSSDVTADQVRAWDAETLEASRLHTAASLAVYGQEVAATFASLIEFVQTADAETLLAAQAYADDRPAQSWYAIPDKPESFPPALHYHRWVDIEEKPEQFQPLAHAHRIADVTGLTDALAAKSPIGHTHDAATLVGLHAGLVGLGNVDNTRDAQKPVSTAQAAAIEQKANASHQHSAADTTSGVFAPARLGAGVANGSNFLSGDGTYKVPPSATNAQIETAVNAYLSANPPSGKVPLVYFQSPSSGNPTQQYAGAFNYVRYNTTAAPVRNTGGGTWDSSAARWQVPVSGAYLLSGTFRVPDNTTPKRSFFHTVYLQGSGDGAHGNWGPLGGNLTGETRASSVFQKVQFLTAGQWLQQIIYVDGGAVTQATTAGGDPSWSAMLLNTTG